MSTTAKSSAERTSRFINDVEPIWCSGCGDFAVLDALSLALESRGLTTHEVALVTGIGCGARLPGYMSCYGFNAIHGRALPIACGLKLARPELTVIAAGGDGDGFSIGAGHLLHAVRRNLDITYLVMDNGVYGLTKGQASPTTPFGETMRGADSGTGEMPLNPLELMLAFGAGYIAQSYSADAGELAARIDDAIGYRGFSFVNIISPCPTFRGGMGIYKDLRRVVRKLDASNHDSADIEQAYRVARDTASLHSGLIYRREPAAAAERNAAGETALLEALTERYR